jgi:tetratricopeptide (TPR) repeat protein
MKTSPFRLYAVVAPVLALTLFGCRHFPSEQERKGAEIHYDLGVQDQDNGDVQGALSQFQQALKLDDGFAEAHNACALLLHLSFDRKDEAIVHYRRALELRPSFSEAKVNLANVYLSEARYDEAIKLYQEALNDMLYSTPFIAQNNLGWALYKKGDVANGVSNIRTSVTTNPKFCSGYRNLGIIAEEQGNVQEACDEYASFQEKCPTVAEADLREGLCLTRQGKREKAKSAFEACVGKAGDERVKRECREKIEQLGGSAARETR